MKKKLTALVLAVALMVSIPVSAFAAHGFNKAVFDNAPDVYVQKDDMTGKIIAASESLLGDGGYLLPTSGGGLIKMYSGVSISDELNANMILFKYYAQNWAFINSIIVKVGNKRYRFTDISVDRSVMKDASIQETVYLHMNSSAVPFMQDLINHRDEEIKVRLVGSNRDVDFVLTDTVKNGIINIYNLFVAGGGTSKQSLKDMDLATGEQVVTVSQD